MLLQLSITGYDIVSAVFSTYNLASKVSCQMPKCNTYQSITKMKYFLNFWREPITWSLQGSFKDYHFQKMALYVQGKYCNV